MTSVILNGHRGHQLFCVRRRKIMLTSLALIFLVGLALAALCQKLKLPRIIGMLATGILLGPCVLNVLGRLDFVDLSRPAQARARYYPAQGGTVARFGRPQKGRPSGNPDVVPARNVRDHRLCAARAVLPWHHARGGGGHGRGARGGVARGRRAAHGAADGKRPRNGQEHPADDPGWRIVRRYLRHCAVYNVSAHGRRGGSANAADF